MIEPPARARRAGAAAGARPARLELPYTYRGAASCS
jgi:hypothetical protein